MRKTVIGKTINPPKATKKPKVRARKVAVRGVRTTLLALLTEGAQTRPQLLKKSGCSPASLHNHIKDLRGDGIVVADPSNRLLSLKSEAASPLLETDLIHAAAAESLGTALDTKLVGALDALSVRLNPITRSQEKLLVLERLAQSAPDPVADILRLIFDDLSRITEGTAEA